MPRIARLVVKDEKTVYHVMSRTVLDGYVLEDVEKDFLLRHIRWLQKIYFAEVLGLLFIQLNSLRKNVLYVCLFRKLHHLGKKNGF